MKGEEAAVVGDVANQRQMHFLGGWSARKVRKKSIYRAVLAEQTLPASVTAINMEMSDDI